VCYCWVSVIFHCRNYSLHVFVDFVKYLFPLKYDWGIFVGDGEWCAQINFSYKADIIEKVVKIFCIQDIMERRKTVLVFSTTCCIFYYLFPKFFYSIFFSKNCRFDFSSIRLLPATKRGIMYLIILLNMMTWKQFTK